MKLPEQAVREFQAAWFESFGENISYEVAEIEANDLLALYDTSTKINFSL